MVGALWDKDVFKLDYKSIRSCYGMKNDLILEMDPFN